MADRSLRFNIFANDRASEAFRRIENAIDKCTRRIVGFNGKRAKARIDADISNLERNLAKAEAELERFEGQRTVRIDAETREASRKLGDFAHELNEIEKSRATAHVQISAKEGELRSLQAQLDSLGRQTQTPLIRVETAKTLRDIQKIKGEIVSIGNLHPDVVIEIDAEYSKLDRLRAQLKSLESQPTTPRITLEVGRVQAEIATVEKSLERLNRSIHPDVQLRERGVKREIDELVMELQALDHMRASPDLDVDTAAASARIAAIQAQLATLRDRRVDIEVRGDTRGIFGQLGRLYARIRANVILAAQFARALSVLAMPAVFASLLGSMASLGATLRDVIGLAGLLPGAFIQTGLVIGTLMIGMRSFKDAFAVLDSPIKIERYNAALAKMAPTAKEFVLAIRGLGPAWDSVRTEVQTRLFAGMAGLMKSVAGVYIPLLKQGFGGIASSLNIVATKLLLFFRSIEGIKLMRAQFTLSELTLKKLSPAITNIVEAFLRIGRVGGSFLPGLAEGFSRVTGRFAAFLERAEKDGSLQTWIARGIEGVADLGRAILNVGRVFGDLFDAAQKSGKGFVQQIEDVAGALHELFSSARGQQDLVALFENIHAVMKGLIRASSRSSWRSARPSSRFSRRSSGSVSLSLGR